MSFTLFLGTLKNNRAEQQRYTMCCDAKVRFSDHLNNYVWFSDYFTLYRILRENISI